MPQLNSNGLLARLDKQIADAEMSIGELEKSVYTLSAENDFGNEVYDFDLAIFKDRLSSIVLTISALLEMSSLPLLLEQFRKELESFSKDITTLDLMHYTDDLYSPVLIVMRRYQGLLVIALGAGNKERYQSGRSVLERLLRNTPFHVSERQVEPHNEADVQRCVYETLRHVFPDTTREVPIQKVTKNYKGDFGVPSLKTVVEYKFVTSEDEAKKYSEALYADMHGYSGDKNWKYFYSVIYFTELIHTQEQVDEEFRLGKARKNWKQIAVVGAGKRQKKIPKKAAAKKKSAIK